jgi:hypothetical protein
MNQPIASPSVQPTQIDSQDILSDYADIRWQMACLEAKLKEIEPMAIERALTLINQGETTNGKRVVHRTATVDVTLQLRTSKPKPNDHPNLETLKELIDIESEKATQRNHEAISLVEQELAVLQSQLESLKQTDEGMNYQAQYEALTEQLTTQKPILCVRLK